MDAFPMSPQFEYRCPNRHTQTKLRKFEERDQPLVCECGEPMDRIWSAHHAQPDGIYSYEPNIGSADNFERKQAMIERNRERAKDGKPYSVEGD